MRVSHIIRYYIDGKKWRVYSGQKKEKSRKQVVWGNLHFLRCSIGGFTHTLCHTPTLTHWLTFTPTQPHIHTYISTPPYPHPHTDVRVVSPPISPRCILTRSHPTRHFAPRTPTPTWWGGVYVYVCMHVCVYVYVRACVRAWVSEWVSVSVWMCGDNIVTSSRTPPSISPLSTPAPSPSRIITTTSSITHLLRWLYDCSICFCQGSILRLAYKICRCHTTPLNNGVWVCISDRRFQLVHLNTLCAGYITMHSPVFWALKITYIC